MALKDVLYIFCNLTKLKLKLYKLSMNCNIMLVVLQAKL